MSAPTGAPVRTLSAVGWDHERCMRPMRACATAWEQRHGVRVSWSARSLRAFGDDALDEIAGEHDLLVIDHPMCGAAARTGCLIALDELIAPDVLAALARASAGPSHASYRHAGHQWALATDAACQVSAFRPDLLDAAPRTWEAVLALARTGAVAVPLAPAHAISSFLSLCANAGAPPAAGSALAERGAGVRALELLGELSRLGPPEALGWEPPDLLARMTQGDAIAYCPLVYGYVSYAAGLRFADIPGVRGATLGGAGLAVSSASADPERAAAFAAWVASPGTQEGVVAPNGGQPATAGAWTSPAGDRAAKGFYSATRATLEAAWTRPRAHWWSGFQREAGEALTRALAARVPAGEALDELQDIYDRRRRAA